VGYKNKTKQRAYQLDRYHRLRVAWLVQNGPCKLCGSKEDLEVDHIDAKKKVSHRIWCWSLPRREAELKKCRVLCRSCHQKKTAEALDGSYKIPSEVVKEIREKASAYSIRELVVLFGFSRSQIHRIVTNRARKVA
jgi:rRNA maturation endonuclease Nob1